MYRQSYPGEATTSPQGWRSDFSSKGWKRDPVFSQAKHSLSQNTRHLATVSRARASDPPCEKQETWLKYRKESSATIRRDCLKEALEKLIVPQRGRRLSDEAIKRGILKNCLISNAARDWNSRMRNGQMASPEGLSMVFLAHN